MRKINHCTLYETWDLLSPLRQFTRNAFSDLLPACKLEAENSPHPRHRSPWEVGPKDEASFAAGKSTLHVPVLNRAVKKPAEGSQM